MMEIIKYQLKSRKGSMLLILSIFGILNVVAFLIEAGGGIRPSGGSMGGLGFWVFIAFMATGVITAVMFFLCGSGHVNDLLYKDTSYLMMTVPRRGREILGGRLIAGVIEFAAYFIAALFLAAVHLSIIGSTGTADTLNPLQIFGFIFEQVFFVNFASVAKLFAIGASFFALTGTLLTFAVVASRSFVRNKGIATAIAIAVFFFITNEATRFGAFLSEKLGWYWSIQPVLKPESSIFLNYAKLSGGAFSMGNMPTGQIPMAPVALALILACLLFAAASWLMEKKVEL